MKEKRISLWVPVICYILSCALCVWAWLFAIHLLFFGISIVPAFFLQMIIRRGGKEWNWLLTIHAVILLCTLGVGGLIWILGKNWEPLYGMLLAAMAGSALAGCLLEFVLYLFFSGKDDRNETQN